jgi:general secretion pathway protein K
MAAAVGILPGALPVNMRPSSRDQSGIALVLVLWLTILLTVIASGFAYTMRTEALAARNAIALAQARAVADGAIARMSFELMRPRLAVGETWAADGAVHYWNDGGTSIAANVVDESGKIDLNAGSDALLKALLQSAGGVDPDTAAHLVDAIDDWKTPGDVKRPNGAKAADYKAAGLSYGPANAPFETVADLERVLGMTPALYAAVADSLTIYSRQAGVNPAFASRTVLLAFPNATPDVVDAYIAQRNDALNNRQPVPPFALASTGAAPVNIWRIRAEATTPDNATFVRDAVIRQGGDALHPVTVLLWQEGDRRLFAPPPQPQ